MYKIKHRPEDFIVSEILDLSFAEGSGEFKYYLLAKTGLTTFDAIARIAAANYLDQQAIGYAGLKDEDGVTEQFISVEGGLDEHFVANLALSTDGYTLTLLGSGATDIQVAQNAGNRFRITLRNLDQDAVRHVHQGRGKEFYFINYYDDQRFGLPDRPKNTHLIGEHYLNGRYEQCLALGIESGVLLPGVEIGNVPVKQRAFWLSSSGSAEWNQRVTEWVRGHYDDVHVIEGAAGPLALVPSEALRRAPPPKGIPIRKYRAVGDAIVEKRGERNTVENFVLHVRDSGVCDAFPGRAYVTIEFDLATGVYATMAVKALLGAHAVRSVHALGEAAACGT